MIMDQRITVLMSKQNFLQSVLDRAMYFIDDNTSMNINDTQTYLVVIDQTISLLRQILWDVDDDDRQKWQVIEGCFESILEHLTCVSHRA